MSASDLETQFKAAAERVRTQPAPTKTVPDEERLKVYALYKQATVGDCNTERPGGLLNWAEKAKWDAWNGIKGKAKEAAMSEYIEETERQQKVYA